MRTRSTMRLHLALCAAVLMTGLSAHAADAPPDSVLRASGNEPGWSLVLNRQTLALSFPDGSRIEVATPAPERVDARTLRYATAAAGGPLRVEVVDGICRDSMTGMPRPKTVSVTLKDRQLKGCGGDPASLLAQHAWSIVSVAATPAEAGQPTEMTFARDGQVSGSAGCNRFAGGYELTGETLTFGPLAATNMACPPPLMEQESRVFELLQAVRGFDVTPGGELVLLAPDGRRLVARPGP